MAVLYAIKAIALGALLPLFDIGSDIFNAYTYFTKGDIWWSGFTIGFILLPGLMELLYWIISYLMKRDTSLREALYYSFAFGPFTFPLATPIWQIIHGIKGTSYSKAMVFKSLEAYLESAPQLLLQLTILIIKWTHVGDHWIQLISVASSSIFLSLTSAEHHIHELSAKESAPKFRQILLSAPFFLINALLRTFLMAIIIAYLKWWFVLVLLGTILLNFILSALILKTELPKDLWTSVSSTLGLACFVSAEDIHKHDSPSATFHKYFLANVFSLGGILSGVLGGLAVLLQRGLLTYTCEDTPVFSCSRDTCPHRRTCQENEEPHDFFIYVMMPIWAGLMLLHIGIVSIMRLICPYLMPYKFMGSRI